MLLRWPDDIQLTGITTIAEASGRRAGYVRYVLELEKRNDIPVAAGADVSEGFYRYPAMDYPQEERYWPEPIHPSPNAIEGAICLLKKSIEEGASIVCVGPFTNLYLLDLRYPGILMQANLFLMGGYINPIRSGFPKWGNNMDWNIQADVKSAKHVIENSRPTLVPLTVTVETALRRAYLNDLQKSGILGKLLAKQAEAFAVDEEMEKRFGGNCEGLPKDFINFLHDPLACAIALGWNDGVEIEELHLILEEKEGWLTERIQPSGKPVRVVTKINGSRFSNFWINQIVSKNLQIHQ
jgi:inosine-uridine nucleoside N-ribohydrolase